MGNYKIIYKKFQNSLSYRIAMKLSVPTFLGEYHYLWKSCHKSADLSPNSAKIILTERYIPVDIPFG